MRAETDEQVQAAITDCALALIRDHVVATPDGEVAEYVRGRFCP